MFTVKMQTRNREPVNYIKIFNIFHLWNFNKNQIPVIKMSHIKLFITW